MRYLPDYTVDSLQATPRNTDSVLSQANATLTQPYQPVQFAEESAGAIAVRLDSTREEIRMALIAYQTGKVDFLTLSAVFSRAYAAGIAFLKDANQFLAREVALERAVGVQFPG